MKSKRNSADDLKRMEQHTPLRLFKDPERGIDNVAGRREEKGDILSSPFSMWQGGCPRSSLEGDIGIVRGLKKLKIFKTLDFKSKASATSSPSVDRKQMCWFFNLNYPAHHSSEGHSRKPLAISDSLNKHHPQSLPVFTRAKIDAEGGL